MVFPTLFKSEFCNNDSQVLLGPQSGPGIVFADSIEFPHFGCKEYNQSDVSVDPLVMHMCRVIYCVIGRGCLL